MNTFKLTIGIPTYNRCDVINGALDSVMAQVSALNNVDVLVVDNASTDRTKDVVQRYQKQFDGKITYIKNETNIGFAANVDTVVKNSAGDYVLILSDDDALEAGAVKYVLDILSNYRVVALFLGVEAWNRELSAPLRSRSGVHVPNGRVFDNGSEYVIEEKAFPPGCISGYVVNKDAWVGASALDFRETLVVQVLVVLRMAKNMPIYVSYLPHVRFRTENNNGDKTFYRLPLGLFRHRVEPLEGLASACDGYPAETLRILRRNAMRTIIYHLIVDDNRGVDFKELERRVVAACGRFDMYTLIVSVLIRLPVPVRRICRSAMAVVRERGPL